MRLCGSAWQTVESQLDDERWRDYVWTETSKAVDGLASGGPYQFHSYLLPPDHPMLAALGPYAWLEIGADDVVRPFDRSASASRGPAPG